MIIPDSKKTKAVMVADFRMKPDADGSHERLMHIGDDLLNAINNKSRGDLILALKAFFHECEMEPHEEYGEEGSEP